MPQPISISVKWGKKELEVIEIDLETVGARGLKQEILEKTGVPIERQKLMCKTRPSIWKGVLKDEENFSTIDFTKFQQNNKKPIINVLLMGSAEQVPLKGPTTKTIFLEDLPQHEIAKVAEPAGLVNLGNTCYLNSVIQCLRVIPPLQNKLQQYYHHPTNNSNATNSAATSSVLVTALKETYYRLSRQTQPLQPLGLVAAVKHAFPQFAQLSANGQPMQQDAEEFYSGLLSQMENVQKNLANDIFGFTLQETLTCDDNEQEQPVISKDLHRKLVCNIQGGTVATAATSADTGNNVVNHIAEGIQLGLSGKIEKHSDLLNRDAMWTRSQRIAQLPTVLTVQFGRFYWKATPDSQDHAGVKCKVMKPVSFTSDLDVLDFCTTEIQTVLRASRAKALAAQEDEINRKLLLKGQQQQANGSNDEKDKKEEEENAMDTSTSEAVAAAAATKGDDTKGGEKTGMVDTPMEETEEEEQDPDLQAALAMSMEPDHAEIFGNTSIPHDFQGYYELFAVVTHKGRDADGGHYMAWVKADHHDGDNSKKAEKIADTDILNEDWYVFDDDEVSPCKTEDVLKLKGGGDWHMSYLNFYRIKK